MTALSTELGNLKNLELLNLANNQLTSLPKEMGNLLNLQSLVPWGNQLTEFPCELGNLQKLTHFRMNSEHLGTWGKKKLGGILKRSLVKTPIQIDY